MKWKVSLIFIFTVFPHNSLTDPLPDFHYTFIDNCKKMGYFELTLNDNITINPIVLDPKSSETASSIPTPPIVLFFLSGLIGFYLAGQKFRK